MSRQVVLVGCGGHGRVALDALLAGGVAVYGIVDPALQVGTAIFGVPVLGGDDVLGGFDSSTVMLVNGVGANPSVAARRDVFESLRRRGFVFHPLRHPAAVVGRQCVLEAGAQVHAGAVLQPGVVVGENAVVNTSASIDHDTVIGRHAFVAPGVVLCGGVTVDDAAFVGAGAVVLPGVHIGKGAIVGAGALVRRPVAAGTTLAGDPAAVLRGAAHPT
jgi:UDP-perosamine 4-acetyltransferase